MNSRERRIDTRIKSECTFTFSRAEHSKFAGITGESINISQRGILFATAVPLVVGTPLSVA